MGTVFKMAYHEDEELGTEEVVSGCESRTDVDTTKLDKKPNDENHNYDVGCCGTVNKRLLVSKLFYLFFSSAFGCVAPYLALYFKQIFISPRQLGIIVSVRSFVQFLFAPIWSACAERYEKRLFVILIGIVAYATCYVIIPFIPLSEKPTSCTRILPKEETNDFQILNTSFPLSSFSKPKETSLSVNPPRSDEGEDYYYLPWSLFYSPHINKKKSEKRNHYVKLSVTEGAKHISDTSPLFLSILLVTTVGYIFGSPTQTLADIATLQCLGTGRLHEYGRQAVFGSVGYGIVSFVVGASLSELKKKNPCNGNLDTNYMPCFICFGVLMTMCLMVATRFRFHDIGEDRRERIQTTGWRKMISLEYAVFITVVFFCGSASGFIGTFLFWHLHELGGPQLLFSFISLLNSSAEVCVYLESHRFVKALGHSRVIYLGLVCYGIRFFYYSYCEKPWLFLPIELIQGITSAAVWSAFVYHVGNDTENSTTLQGVVNGVYGGLGYAAGGLVGGGLVHEVGTSAAFLMYGEACLVVLCLFLLANRNRDQPSSQSDGTSQSNSDESKAE